MLEEPGFWILAAYAVLVTSLSRTVTAAVKDAEGELSGEEIETYRRDFARQKSARATMPTKFNQLASAQDRASRFWIFSMAVLVGLLIAYVFLGPNMGLPL